MSKISTVYYSTLAGITVATLDAMSAFAQSIDPAAPLDFLRTSREKAAASNLNVDSVTSGGGSLATIVAVFSAVVGLVLCAFSGHKLYRSVQDENSRESTGASIGGFAIGACLTIVGIMVGVVTGFATN